MTVSQLAKHVGLTPRAVRFYEAEGLLAPPTRAPSGYRLYTDADLDLLRMVAGLRGVGLALADIREVLRLREHGIPPPDRIVALITARVAEVDRDVTALNQRREALVNVLQRIHSGGACARLCRVVDEQHNASV